jgi:hypothetical protein
MSPYEKQRAKETAYVLKLREDLITRHAEWKASPLAEHPWYKLLMGETDLSKFYVAFKYLIEYWLARDVIRVGGLIKINHYLLLWMCLPDSTKQGQPDLVALVERYIDNPYVRCCSSTRETLKGPVDISSYFERFLNNEVVTDYNHAIKIAKSLIEKEAA